MIKHLILPLALCISTLGHAQEYQGFTPASAEKQKSIEQQFLQSVDFGRFITHLTAITSEPHVAGSAANERVKDYLVKTTQAAGWDTKVYQYDVYLSKEPGESLVEIVQPFRRPLNQQEDILAEDPYSSHPDLWKGWNAYSGSGDVIAEVVYANYGTKADFEKLKEMGIDVKGKIVLARYGGNFRGYKAKFAEENGAIGLIIFTDPGDSGYMKGLMYPDGTFYNESSIQRGSLLTVNHTGDPLTPFEPALPLDGKKKITRKNPADVALPKIPVSPIPFGSAKEIMQLMSGKPVPAGWQGGMPFTYRLEGGEALKVRLKVKQERGFVRANNVVGTLVGSEYPDEWVILGCHYDAWAFGATDPNSGTSMLLALTETLGKMAKEGIRPKRSILIAHWDAEEHGVIGSSEWVEHLKDDLMAKSVAYLNFDGAVSGRNFGASASPTLKQVIIESSKAVNYPDSAKSVYQVWAGQKAEPTIGTLGGGSDHIAFYMYAGIPSLNGGSGGPTLYHTNYDDLHFYKKFVDPSLKMGGAVEQLVGVMTLKLANADIIPYDVARYAADLVGHFDKAETEVKAYHGEFEGFSISKKALENLKANSDALTEKLNGLISSGSLSTAKIKAINQKMLGLEKCWLDEKGMYFGSWYKSLYVATDPFSGYASWVLPGIRYEVELKATDKLQEWDERYAKAISSLSQKVVDMTKLVQ